MALVGDDLGRHVLGRSAKGPGLLPVVQFPGKAKVCQLDVSRGVNEQVLWLEISVDDPLVMEILKRKNDAGHVKLGRVVTEPLASSQQGPELAPKTGLHEHVEKLGVMICLVKFYYEWTVTVLHYHFLIQDVLLLFRVLNLE